MYFLGLVIFPVHIIRQGKLAKEGPWEGEILVLEKNVWGKSCFKYLDLQNELPYVEIGPQIKKFVFFGLDV